MSRQNNYRGPISATNSINNRPQKSVENEKGMWSSMLDSVASGKKLPEKHLIVLGGNPDTQKEFLDTLNSDAPKRPQDRHRRKPVIANEFALGYTYQDVLDADQEDILARLSIYLLPESSPSFSMLIKPLFTPQSIPETLVVILLDWNEPWHWVRQLRLWVSMLRNITSRLDDTSKDTMEQIMREWKQRKRGVSTYDTGASGPGNVTLPLSPGEWDEPLGCPVCVACHRADKIDALEVEQKWKEEDFDFVLQLLRTILMKHGASLIYTSNSVPNSLPTLIHSTLGIHSPLKKQTIKHNVIDRDKVLIPPNWDSWGKIRVLREGFDVETTSSWWSKDIAQAIEVLSDDLESTPAEPLPESSVLPLYESTIPNPRANRSTARTTEPHIEVSAPSIQSFLATQLEALERLKADEERAASPTSNSPNNFSNRQHDERVNDHIGPVQVNMGGIQVDADDMLKKLVKSRDREKERERGNIVSNRGVSGEIEVGEGLNAAGGKGPDDMKAQNEALNSFFAGLMKRGPSGSPRGMPSGEKRSASRDTPSKKMTPKE